MGEPLDGKFEPYGCFSMDDIKSAVEWLKEELLNIPSQDVMNYEDLVFDKINQAFPDIKEKK